MGLIETADIMCHAVAQGLMSISDGENLWKENEGSPSQTPGWGLRRCVQACPGFLNDV